ncbi:MAG: hypothetical protein H6Q00_1323 [Holophagaceae bacterium]|nr:hypothetical protein [Holophagaceae bacterium]
MRKVLPSSIALALFTASLVTICSPAQAAEVKMIATIERIELKEKSATVTLKDTKSDKHVSVTVNDDLTLDKLRDKRILEGDEIRLKYDDATGVATYFRKTAGC